MIRAILTFVAIVFPVGMALMFHRWPLLSVAVSLLLVCIVQLEAIGDPRRKAPEQRPAERKEPSP